MPRLRQLQSAFDEILSRPEEGVHGLPQGDQGDPVLVALRIANAIHRAVYGDERPVAETR